MGARNAMTFASRNPEKLGKLILVDMGPDINRDGGQRISREIVEVPEEFDSFDAVVEYMNKQNRFASDSVIRRRLTYATKLLSNGKIGWKYDLAIREARRQGTVPPNQDLWPEIPRITCPTLIVRGADTDILTAETAQRMVEVILEASAMLDRCLLAGQSGVDDLTLPIPPGDESAQVVSANVPAGSAAGARPFTQCG